jgi:methionyl-tRNA formyltransferase
MIVAAYGCILPKAVLEVPRLGCINIHASLLPRWRGAAPIQRAILAGDAETGISIMQMNEGLDTGEVLTRRAIAIGEQETAGELHDRLAVLGGQLVVEALADLPAATPQENAKATYAAKVTTAEAVINWRESSSQVLRKIRAFNPFPGASAQLAGERIKVWRASLAQASGEAATVCKADASGITIACGSGAINVTELQRAGGKRLPVNAFLAGHPLAPGSRFAV